MSSTFTANPFSPNLPTLHSTSPFILPSNPHPTSNHNPLPTLPMKRARHHPNALQKANELQLLEQRLQAASQRAGRSGYQTLAASYHRQTLAVRVERERWVELAHQTSHAPRSLLPGFKLADLFSAGGAAAERLARFALSLLLLLFAFIMAGGTVSNSGVVAEDVIPKPWVDEIAKVELRRKRRRPNSTATSRLVTRAHRQP